MSAQRFSIKQALYEALFVVLGVGLAFMANEWRESRNAQEDAAIAVAAILEELKSNQQAMQASHEYHAELIQMISAAMHKNEPLESSSFSKGFISPALVYSAAFESAITIGAMEYLPYDDFLMISKLYAMQERYADQSRMVGTIIYDRMFTQGLEGVIENPRNILTIIGTFVYREQSLVSQYRDVLADFDSLE